MIGVAIVENASLRRRAGKIAAFLGARDSVMGARRFALGPARCAAARIVRHRDAVLVAPNRPSDITRQGRRLPQAPKQPRDIALRLRAEDTAILAAATPGA